MSTIFGHGRLRLYLLKLLDESPRHGYEIISLLRDRFLGVYSPSPGTIYPRLSRLEEEGLVTHEEVDGRKVYRLTDKGREELHSRSADIDDLEREITDSVRDVAEAVREDVRHTISSLREELKGGGAGRRPRGEGADGAGESGAAGGGAGSARGGENADDREEASRGSRWTRDWERFAQGFGAWGKRPGERPEFDQALRDFSERVRDVVREAGQAGESAAHDLRRILDDTFETIRRDVGNWGPQDKAEREEDDRCHGGSPGSSTCGGTGTAGDSAGGADTGTDTGTGKAGAASGSAEPERGGASGGSAGPADPWSTAVGGRGAAGGADAGERPGAHGRHEESSDEPNEASGGTADPWGTAVNEDGDRRDGGSAS
ncbi:PadR family transcriptional regulator [Streptomonospora wellingtoniae]|uniref:Helix-turn-helix transcriptional regulator n=1 Tax=Streptomonospora wellingtoniae TaxID=3075544 RepID=A0ABU2KQK5_9ACTN|nr:helix-turn-helix transcriptional regulator [Streptomonospora sp. DSM 45055]MDT0301557.1 helix-turn-helix transcriptional regulator [Streptomonospora sp. DSM 45055]